MTLIKLNNNLTLLLIYTYIYLYIHTYQGKKAKYNVEPEQWSDNKKSFQNLFQQQC